MLLVAAGGEGLVYVHHCGEEVVPVGDLKGYLDGEAVGWLRVLGLEEWVVGAMERGLIKVVGSFMLASKGVIWVSLLEKSRGSGYVVEYLVMSG